jgi:hypothetical protein
MLRTYECAVQPPHPQHMVRDHKQTLVYVYYIRCMQTAVAMGIVNV